VLNELDSVQGSLRAVHDQASEFRELNKDLVRTLESIQVLDIDLDGRAQRRKELDRLVSAWDPWIDLRDVRRQLDELPHVEEFPEEPISRLDNLAERLQEEREVVAEAKERLEQAQEKICLPIPDAMLLERIAEINTVRERRGAFIDSLRDLPERQAEARAGGSALQDDLRALGSEWTSERVQSFDISITRVDEIDQRQKKLAQYELEKRDSEQTAEGIAGELLEAEQRFELLKSSDSQLSKTENQPKQRTMRRILPALVLLIVGIVLVAIGAIVNVPLLIGLGTVSAIAGVGVLVQYLVLTANTRGQEISTDSGGLAEVKRTVDRLRARSNSAIEASRVAGSTTEKAVEDWVEWLRSSNMPVSLAPEAASRFISQIEIVSRRVVDVSERLDRADAIQQDIDEYRLLVAPITEAIGLGLGEDSHSVLGVSDQIISRYEEARDSSQERRSDEASVIARENDASQAERLLGEIESSYNELLNAGGTDDAEEFRRRAADHSKRSELVSREQELIGALHRVIGPDSDLTELDLKFTDTSFEAMTSELSAIILELSELNTQRDALQNRHGELTNEIAKLKGDEDASRLRTRRALLSDQLIAHADEWSRYSIARSLLERTRQKYEKERQPAVLEKASTYLNSLTEGRYERVYQPIDSQGIQVIDESVVEGQKAPEKLSRGTREQLYLSMRFAAVDEFGERQERLPLIVDEVLVNFDPVRAIKAAEKFSEISERNQVIVFTCHPWVRDIFNEVDPDARNITLD
jgi:uncharacterized protein YhaN